MAHATVAACAAAASRGCPGRCGNRCGASSGRARAICCRWTLSAWPGSRDPGTRSRETGIAPALRSGCGLAGVLPLDHRRPLPAGLHRDPRRRAGRHGHRVRRTRA
jgi:hypothetical protein